MTSAADLSGYAVLTSDYVFRGVTFSDGHFAAQVGADVSFDSGFYAGVWASSIDIERANTSDRDWEIDYYAGYTHELSDTFALGANIVVYTFPESRWSDRLRIRRTRIESQLRRSLVVRVQLLARRI